MAELIACLLSDPDPCCPILTVAKPNTHGPDRCAEGQRADVARYRRLIIFSNDLKPVRELDAVNVSALGLDLHVITMRLFDDPIPAPDVDEHHPAGCSKAPVRDGRPLDVK